MAAQQESGTKDCLNQRWRVRKTSLRMQISRLRFLVCGSVDDGKSTLIGRLLFDSKLAAAYASGIIRNHPFVDGNKRTALVVAIAFLERNGITFSASQQEAYFMFYDLAAGRISEDDLTVWFEKNSAPAPE